MGLPVGVAAIRAAPKMIKNLPILPKAPRIKYEVFKGLKGDKINRIGKYNEDFLKRQAQADEWARNWAQETAKNRGIKIPQQNTQFKPQQQPSPKEIKTQLNDPKTRLQGDEITQFAPRPSRDAVVETLKNKLKRGAEDSAKVLKDSIKSNLKDSIIKKPTQQLFPPGAEIITDPLVDLAEDLIQLLQKPDEQEIKKQFPPETEITTESQRKETRIPLKECVRIRAYPSSKPYEYWRQYNPEFIRQWRLFPPTELAFISISIATVSTGWVKNPLTGIWEQKTTAFASGTTELGRYFQNDYLKLTGISWFQTVDNSPPLGETFTSLEFSSCEIEQWKKSIEYSERANTPDPPLPPKKKKKKEKDMECCDDIKAMLTIQRKAQKEQTEYIEKLMVWTGAHPGKMTVQKSLVTPPPEDWDFANMAVDFMMDPTGAAATAIRNWTMSWWTKEPETVDLKSIPEVVNWAVENFYSFLGEFGFNVDIPIQISQNAEGETGNITSETQTIHIPNISVAIKQILMLLINLQDDETRLKSIGLRALLSSRLAQESSIRNEYLSQAILDILGYPTKQESLTVPCPFNLNERGEYNINQDDAELDKFLENSYTYLPITKAAGETDLKDDLRPLLEAASVIMAQFAYRIPGGIADEAMREVLRGVVRNYMSKRPQTGGSDDFGTFLNKAEQGFSTEGVTDPLNPYGRNFEERPRIRDLKAENQENQT